MGRIFCPRENKPVESCLNCRFFVKDWGCFEEKKERNKRIFG